MRVCRSFFRSATIGASVISIALLAAPCGAAEPAGATADRARARAILEELVGIDSTHAHGSTGVAKAIAARLSLAGYPASDLDLVEPEPGKGSLLVHVHGTGKQPARLVIGHLDVVEALPEDWSVPPFKLTEKDGYFYGRGTEDMKSGVAVAVTNLIRLRTEGWKPARDLYFAFTSDEEAGGTLNGVEWLLGNRPALKKVEYVVNFDSGGISSKQGVPFIMKVQTGEKVYATWELEITNPGGHSSLPTADNAIYRLAHGLTRLEDYRFPMHLTRTTRGFLRGIAPTQPTALQSDLLAVADHDDAAAADYIGPDTKVIDLQRALAHDVRGDAGSGRTRRVRTAPARRRDHPVPRDAGRGNRCHRGDDHTRCRGPRYRDPRGRSGHHESRDGREPAPARRHYQADAVLLAGFAGRAQHGCWRLRQCLCGQCWNSGLRHLWHGHGLR